MYPFRTAPFVLPDHISLTYVGEGAANVVYRMEIRPEQPPEIPPSQLSNPWLVVVAKQRDQFIRPFRNLSNKLLRLRKDLPTTSPTQVSQNDWLRLLAPLFYPDQLVEQQLARISDRTLIKSLNHELKARFLQGKSRFGTYLADDEYGLLITDMTPNGSRTPARSKTQKVIEFKPKWLLQSPNAPHHSRRCRTCAINARRLAHHSSSLGPPICPLRMVLKHKDPQVCRYNWIEIFTILLGQNLDTHTITPIIAWLDRGLIPKLRNLQAKLDPHGVLSHMYHDGPSENLRVAMTLRDCSLYVRIDENNKVLESRIGDLDLKASEKFEDWKEKERQLLDEGWYLGIESLKYGVGGEETCLLAPGTRMKFPFVEGGWATPVGVKVEREMEKVREWAGMTDKEFEKIGRDRRPGRERRRNSVAGKMYGTSKLGV